MSTNNTMTRTEEIDAAQNRRDAKRAKTAAAEAAYAAEMKAPVVVTVRRATDKQRAFLRTLAERTGLESLAAAASNQNTTIGEASTLISQYVNV